MSHGKITRDYTVWCALCNGWMYCEGNSAKQAARAAREARWRHTRQHGWLCPDCAGQHARPRTLPRAKQSRFSTGMVSNFRGQPLTCMSPGCKELAIEFHKQDIFTFGYCETHRQGET